MRALGGVNLGGFGALALKKSRAKNSAKVFLTEVFGNPLGSWTCALRVMDVRADMLVFPGF